MTDRPIIFSVAMVRALLDGRKCQTRRVLKRQPPAGLDAGFLRIEGAPFARLTHGRVILRDRFPYEVGDRLWVRENFALVGGGDPGIFLAAADWREQCAALGLENCDEPPRWTPSIHMPRRLSRLTLAVTDVRVQRLNDISEKDAIDEGASPFFVQPNDGASPYTEGFRMLWESLHGEGSWTANPWVVAVTFTVERRNIDEVTR